VKRCKLVGRPITLARDKFDTMERFWIQNQIQTSHFLDGRQPSTMDTIFGPPQEGVDFSSLPWNLNLPEHHSYVHIKTTTNEWNDEDFDDNLESSIFSYHNAPLGLRPATTSLNYGTTIWEGLKCYRLENGTAAVYRADRNYERMKNGAAEMCLAMPSRRLFFRAIQLAVQANAHLIPPVGDGMKLYIRPMLIGSGEQLGLYPSPEFSFLVYVSPTGNYFKASASGLNLHLETKRARAAVGGLGSTKCSGNYAIALKPLMDCKRQGFMDNIFLELETYTKGQIGSAVIQEMSAANVFLVLNTGEIVTPSLQRGTILPGVTRDSVLQLIETYSDELKEAMMASTGQENVFASSRDVLVQEFQQATEAFCTGTAAEMVPIARLATGEGEEAFERVFSFGATLPGGPVTSKLLSLLRESMHGKRVLDPTDPWIRDPFTSADDFGR
jgi:branched-chain amino acid aminotransferase